MPGLLISSIVPVHADYSPGATFTLKGWGRTGFSCKKSMYAFWLFGLPVSTCSLPVPCPALRRAPIIHTWARLFANFNSFSQVGMRVGHALICPRTYFWDVRGMEECPGQLYDKPVCLAQRMLCRPEDFLMYAQKRNTRARITGA